MNAPQQIDADINICSAVILLCDGDDFLCGICGNICNKPMDIGCEKAHVYCERCLKQYLEQLPNKNKTCILCKDKSFIVNEKQIIHNKFAEKQINKLKVQCPYSQAAQTNQKSAVHKEMKKDDYDEGMNIDDTQVKNYCEWIGIFGDILDHINNNCKYKSTYNRVRCSYYKYGCHEILKANDISTHLDKNKLQHLELKMSYQFNTTIAVQNKKIEAMENKMDLQSKAIELSKYNYVSLTSDSVFTAFSTYNNSSYKIPFKQQQWKKTSRYLCTYKQHKINSKLFPSLSKVGHALHIFYKLGEQQNTAYCLESLQCKILPPFKQQGSCTTKCSKKYGLLTVGGWNIKQMKSVSTIQFLAESKQNECDEKKEEKINENSVNNPDQAFEWQKLTQMTTSRYYPSLCEIEGKYLCVAGGDTGKTFLNLCELYDYESASWKTLANLKHQRRSAGCCYWKEKNSIIIGGGYDKTYLRKVEIYDMHKDKWMKLGDTRYGHAGGPNISIRYDFCNNGIIFIAGILSTAFQDMIECYDVRDGKQKWMNVCDIGQKVGFKKESINYSNRPLHSIFSI